MTHATPDIWSEWLRSRRHGGDPAAYAAMMESLRGIRDRVLDHAELRPDDALLDVGCGDGLIGFGALEQLGERGTVIFSDISADLLDQCRATAAELGVSERCRFVRATAESLDGIDDASVDVVTTRSVLIYVADKEAAFAAFHRVLRPGGRLSIFEPINRFPVELPARLTGTFWGYRAEPVRDLVGKLNEASRAPSQTTAHRPMMDFDERDLARLAAEAGFDEVHLELRIDVAGVAPRSWESFVNSAPNPLAPSLQELMERTLTSDEQERLVAHLRPQVERGEGISRSALACLWARR